MGQKGITQIFLILLLLAGIIGGVYLVQKTQIFKPKAYDLPLVVFTDESGKPLAERIDDSSVHIKLNLPYYYELPFTLNPGGGDEASEGAYPVSGPIGIGEGPKMMIQKITLENADDGFGGQEKLVIDSNFEDYFKKPFSWKLNDLKPDTENSQREVRVTFFGTNQEEISTIAGIRLYARVPALDDEVLVDVYVSDKYEDPQEVINWAKSAIDNYANKQLLTYSANRKLKFNESKVVEVGLGCELDLDTSLNKINVVIPKERTNYAFADIYRNKVCLQINVPFGSQMDNILLHEFGHMFGLPDYYMQEVYAYNNQVVPIGISSEIKDIMWNDFDINYFSNNSREIVNRVKTPLPGNVSYWYYYTPVQVIFQVLEDNGLPLPNAKVEVFPSVLQMSMQGESLNFRNTIPDTVAATYVTDNTGRVFLGNQQQLFKANPTIQGFSNGTALLKVTANDEVRYAGITMSYLNTLYFTRGMTNFATFSEPFSRLISAPEGNGKTIQSFIKFAQTQNVNKKDEEGLQRHIYEQLKISGMINAE